MFGISSALLLACEIIFLKKPWFWCGATSLQKGIGERREERCQCWGMYGIHCAVTRCLTLCMHPQKDTELSSGGVCETG